MPISSVVLRFRDLSIEPGETIKRHKELITSQGCVWWGWWSQGNERVATDAYVALHTLTEDTAGMDVYLFDSGQRQTFRAHCAGLEWHPTGKIASPHPDLTPEYYRDRKYLAWWKFTDIQEVDFDVLRGLSYVDTPEHFDPAYSLDYTRFDGKQVSSAQELHEQRRTVWFVRPYVKDVDRDNEIILVGRSAVEPEDFTSKFAQNPSNRLLWLSDLHFDRADHHNFPVSGGDAQKSSLAEAVRAATDELATETATGTSFAGILVSGDVTFHADPVEFGEAVECLSQIASWAGVRDVYEQHLAVAPGNHDIKFSDTPEKPDTPVSAASKDAREAFAGFYKTLFHKPPNEFLCSGRRFLVGNSIPVEVALLNSSLLEQSPEGAVAHFQGQGFVGQSQLDLVTKQLGWNVIPAGKTVRIVVLHHHVIPGVYAEEAKYGANYSVVLDSGRLQQWLFKNRVDLVLHGHQHGSYFARLATPSTTDPEAVKPVEWPTVYVVGLGSAGIVAAKRPNNVPNMFAALTFEGLKVTVDMVSVDPVNAPKHIHRAILELKP